MKKVFDKQGNFESAIVKINNQNKLTIPIETVKALGIVKNQPIKITFVKDKNEFIVEILPFE
jgi:bifunctional DNA-binding transcriptional regulator/antitoxin component of YhaV-PrlF toxin-antitoxin module